MAITLYDDGRHTCLMFNDLVDDEGDHAVQANQFLIVTSGEGALIDPAGNMTYNALIMAMAKYFPARDLKYILASHADPDIVASLNKWLVTTQCKLIVSKLWARFVPHFCSAGNADGRVIGIPDAGMNINIGDSVVKAVPAHFLHAEGNFHFYDVQSKILFSGDMGASMVDAHEIEAPITRVSELHEHIKLMEGFHRRHMVSNKACRLWAQMVRGMDVDMLVPQHGRMMKGKEVVSAFLDWIETLKCGIDLFSESDYQVPR